MRKLLTILFLIFTVSSFAQIPVNRTTTTTPIDYYHRVQKLFGLPILNDTLTFTGSNGLDSLGSEIYVKSGVNKGLWLRDTLPEGGHYWVRNNAAIDSVQSPLYIYTDSSGQRIIAIRQQDGRVSGGIVTWSGVGLIFDVTAATYIINGNYYTSPATQVTLDSADATNPRYDLFIVDTNSVATKITGTPSATPLIPQIDPASQIALTSGFLVNPGDTIPSGISNDIVYDENTEWATSTPSTGVSFVNTQDPYHLTKAIKAVNFLGTDLYFTNSTTLAASDYTILKFYIKRPLQSNRALKIYVTFYHGSTAVTNKYPIGATDGFSSTDTSYQNISIPISNFTFTGAFDKIRISYASSTGSNFLLDYVQLQSGITPIPSPTDYSNKQDSNYVLHDSLFWCVKGVCKYLGQVNGGSAINNGLTSTGPITLVDSTLTIGDTVRWTINGVAYTKTTPSVFTINSADSNYYRRDLIYADTSGNLYKIVGVEDTVIAVIPALPPNSIVVTIVDVFGSQITPPVPNIIGVIPTWQQTMLQGDSTTEQVIIKNETQSPIQITRGNNSPAYVYVKNTSSGTYAGSGIRLVNDYSSSPFDEHSGHFVQLYMGSSTNALVPNGGLLRSNTSNGLAISADSGRIRFMSGFPYTVRPFTEMGAFETNGKLTLKFVDSATANSANVAYFDGDTLKRGNIPIDSITVKNEGTGTSLAWGTNDTLHFKKIQEGTGVTITPNADSSLTISATGISGVASVTGNPTGLVDNTDPANPVIQQDNSKLDKSDSTIANRVTANTTAIAGKQNALTLTTTGTSGTATLSGSTLNIPQYSGGGSSLTRQVITSGSSGTVTGGNYIITFNPSSAITSYALTLPASPSDLDVVEIEAGGTITSAYPVITTFSILPNSGQTLVQAATPSSLNSGEYLKYRYNSSNTSWYREN